MKLVLAGVLVIVVPILVPVIVVAGLQWVAKKLGKTSGLYVGGLLSVAFLTGTIGLWSVHQSSTHGSGWDLMGLSYLILVAGILFVCSALTTYRIKIRY